MDFDTFFQQRTDWCLEAAGFRWANLKFRNGPVQSTEITPLTEHLALATERLSQLPDDQAEDKGALIGFPEDAIAIRRH
jgi:hypothetical protein